MFLVKFKNPIQILTTLKYSIILSLILLAFACGKEQEMINGCTDPDALNYSSEATIDDGSCMLLRDQYIGSFNITTSNCSATDFWENISVDIEADPNNGAGITLKINGFTPALIPIELAAKVDENGIALSDSNIYFFVGGTGVTFLNIYDGIEYVGVTFSMGGRLKPNGDQLDGRLSFTAVNFQDEKMVSTLCDYLWTPA